MRESMKQWLPPILLDAFRRRTSRYESSRLPDAGLYKPLFSPWLSSDFRRRYERIAPFTLVSADRCFVLRSLAQQACHIPGDFLEIGVYRGGTAMLLRDVLEDGSVTATKMLRLFDTFAGMPKTDPDHDLHHEGDFSDTTLDSVKSRVGAHAYVAFHPGMVPRTFDSIGDGPIAFAHVDVDIYRSVMDSCRFIYPRLVPGGTIVFDDYGFPTCPGARAAVDEFFRGKPEVPLVLPTGQAVVTRVFLDRGEVPRHSWTPLEHKDIQET